MYNLKIFRQLDFFNRNVLELDKMLAQNKDTSRVTNFMHKREEHTNLTKK